MPAAALTRGMEEPGITAKLQEWAPAASVSASTSAAPGTSTISDVKPGDILGTETGIPRVSRDRRRQLQQAAPLGTGARMGRGRRPPHHAIPGRLQGARREQGSRRRRPHQRAAPLVAERRQRAHCARQRQHPRLRRPWHSQLARISSVRVESGVTRIGSSAFRGCLNLAMVAIPGDTTVEMGDSRFTECSRTLMDKVSDQMFYNCRIPSFSFRTGRAQSALLPSRGAR